MIKYFEMHIQIKCWSLAGFKDYRTNAVMEAALNIEAIHLFVKKFVECRVKFISDIALTLVL